MDNAPVGTISKEAPYEELMACNAGSEAVPEAAYPNIEHAMRCFPDVLTAEERIKGADRIGDGRSFVHKLPMKPYLGESRNPSALTLVHYANLVCLAPITGRSKLAIALQSDASVDNTTIIICSDNG